MLNHPFLIRPLRTGGGKVKGPDLGGGRRPFRGVDRYFGTYLVLTRDEERGCRNLLKNIKKDQKILEGTLTTWILGLELPFTGFLDDVHFLTIARMKKVGFLNG